MGDCTASNGDYLVGFFCKRYFSKDNIYNFLMDEMESDKFCLKWNDFESNISTAFRDLREDKDFFDVTLACDDEQIEAHKVILSACSPFFKTILKRNRHAHPLLYLRGVKYSDLLSVLNFMYHGEVNVAQEDLNSFLAVAEDMKVKGLTQNNQNSSSKPSEYSTSTPQTARPKPSPRPPEREPAPPPPKRSRPPTFLTRDEPRGDEDVHEVDMPGQVKSEPMTQSIQPLVEMGYEEESFEEYGHEYGQDGGQSYDAGGLAVGADGNKGDENYPAFTSNEDFDVYVSREGPLRVCTLCGIF